MKFREAVRSATHQAMERDPSVILVGVGLIDPRAMWGSIADVLERFGPDRVIEGPVSEAALTGIAVGAATQGLRPMVIHHRVDFIPLSLDQIINHAAKWRDMFGRQQHIPMVVRGVVGRGWGNGSQHTSSHHALFSHLPGLKVVVPSNPRDAKGLLLAAVEDADPVIYIEHRWLHEDEGPVPEEYFTTPIGRAEVVRAGEHATVAAIGTMVPEALKVAGALIEIGLSIEVVDMRTLRPLDIETVLESVARTGRLVVADPDWGSCGVAGEIIARVAERALDTLRAPPARVTWPEMAVPACQLLEGQFYPGAQEVQAAVLRVCQDLRPRPVVESTVKPFNGPF